MAKADNTKKEAEKEEKNVEVTKEDVKVNSAEVSKPEQLIYIGPSLLEITTYTVVKNGYPSHIQGLIKNCPSVQKLFVPVDKFTSLEPKTKQKGTLEYRYYNDVIDYIKNGRKGE